MEEIYILSNEKDNELINKMNDKLKNIKKEIAENIDKTTIISERMEEIRQKIIIINNMISDLD